MERRILSKLKTWKSNKNKKPLVLTGARQVGKTWVMKKFGELEFENTIYINFERDKPLKDLFESDLDLDRILLALQVQTGITPIP